ncbi:TonB-dependent receptor [Flavobacterium sp. Sd200]|uniref:TonB-dependent receptor n=1 Tax=Flavobacterium sp. Sd200 TaxID=2692211 RepID=UPI00136CB127|nr:TonB-dependent receptor plug domain-containing protein [Flavobacterium sp. Sd200]MXN92141.1 TonB-dependent receptor [Flavobacterium sp. Sd200]
MKVYLLAFLFVGLSAWCQTGNINGTVAFADKEQAFGAAVKVVGTAKFATVDADGNFEIKQLAYGDYELEITSAEIETKTVKVKLNRPVVTVNIIANRVNPKLLDEVVMNKTSEKRQIMDKGFAVNVIETQEAGKRNLQTNDLLDRSMGVRVRQNGGLGSSANYNLNGMSGNSVRIFIDGIPIQTYGPSFSLNSIPPALIERIEVYKGVIPIGLADDALGGAINVVLKKGARNTLNASVSYGSFNTTQSQINGVFRRESGFTVKASGFYNYSDNDYEVWGPHVFNILPNGRRELIKAKRFNNAYKSYGARFEAGYTDVKWADNFLIGYNASHDYNEIQHGTYMTRPYKGRFTEADAHVVSLNYSKKDFLIQGLEFNTNAVYSNRSEVVNDTVKYNYNWDGNMALGLRGEPILSPYGAQQGAATIVHVDRQILSARSNLNYSINDNHKILFSHVFYTVDRDDNDELKSELEKRYRETRDLLRNVYSFAYELDAFKSKLKASLFAKHYVQNSEQRIPTLTNGNTQVVVNVTDKTNSATGYGLASSYYITPQVMALLSAERAVRMPTDNEVFGNQGENIVGNATLGPEISDNLNLGFRFGAFKLKKHKVSLSASGFVRDTKDKIVRRILDRNNDALQSLPYVNLGKTQAIGFEAAFEYGFSDRLVINMNMSKFNLLFKDKYDNSGGTLDLYNMQLPNEPFFIINGSAQYNFKDILQKDSDLNFYYGFGYVEPFYTNWLAQEITPAQFVNDLGLSYVFPKNQFILSFDAKNIFDKQVFDNFAVQKPGRAFYLKLNYTINKF